MFKHLQDLAKPGLKVVLADVSVPAGKYARQILDNMSKDPTYGTDFSTKVLANVVSNETDVKQVVAKVQLGEADAGIVYVSDAIAAPTLKTIEIPANLNVVAKYPIAPLVKSANPDLGRAVHRLCPFRRRAGHFEKMGIYSNKIMPEKRKVAGWLLPTRDFPDLYE